MHRYGLLTVLAAASVLPLWTVEYLPGTDLPSHLAIANILAKLVAGDAVAGSFYAINVQPVPYYLVYLALAPLVTFLGALLAAKVFCSVVVLATVLASGRLFRLLDAPWWASSVSVFLAYGMIFFWGFVPTFVGVPVYVFGVSELVRLTRSRGDVSVIAACCAGIALMVTHVALAVPWACALLATWASARRRVVVKSFVIGAVSLLPLAPFVVMRLLQRGQPVALQYEDAAMVWKHVGQQLGVFDRGYGMLTHIGFIAVVAVLALTRRRAGLVDAGTARVLGAFAVLSATAYLATPMAMDAGGDFIWAFNVRLFFAAELALVAWLVADRTGPVRIGDVLPPLAVAGHLCALTVFFAELDAVVRKAEPVLAAIPEGKTLAVASKDGSLGDAWPPQLLHVHGYYLAHHVGYDGAVFNGKHIPIRALQPLCPGNMPEARPTECDYLFAEGSAVAKALDECASMAVSGHFALLRDCGQEAAGVAAR